MGRMYLTAIVVGLLPATLIGQTLERRLGGLDSGTVRLSFASRPGVCGSSVHGINAHAQSDEWEADCENQPVRVALEVRDRRVVAIRTYVGGRWRRSPSINDLGTVRPQEAAAYFLELAGQSRDLNGDPVLPATLADSVTIWPSLLRLARAAHLPEERRRSAVLWLGQAAGNRVTTALDSIVLDDGADRDVRKQAVFALSQRSGTEAVAALIRIARTNQDPEIRRTALFWLGQSQDPRALDLFEEILR
jgi:HEAT repeats